VVVVVVVVVVAVAVAVPVAQQGARRYARPRRVITIAKK
jgi:hypothetical protein